MIDGKTLLETQARLTSALDALAGQVASGKLDFGSFIEAAMHRLDEAHARAAFLGSHRAKRGGDIDVAIQVAARNAREQRAYLQAFAEQIASGQYRSKAQGGKGAGQRKARFALYAIRISGTSNDAWRETHIAVNADVQGRWQLGRHDVHCRDCLREASEGLRLLSEFRFMPGQARTRCLLRCGCVVILESGQESYPL